MATYAELADIRSDPLFNSFLNKVRVAAVKKAVAYLASATPTAGEVAWAKATLANPSAAGDGIVWYVIGANSGAAVSAILGATDNAIQTNVDAAVVKIVA